MSSQKSGSVVAFPIADSAKGIRHVFVRDLLVDARVGIYKHEKKNAQRLRLNLDLSVADTTLAADQIEHVVCYEKVVDQVRALVTQGHVNLVETLAEKIAQAVLTDREVISVRVRVEKLDVLDDVSSVGVEIERTSA